MRLPIRSAPPRASTLSDRGLDLAKLGGILDKFKTILSDPYHPDDNPGGFVNIGTAENVRLTLNVNTISRRSSLCSLLIFRTSIL